MPIEEDIRESIRKLTFLKNLPEFTDRAKHLEERLKSGEKLLVVLDEYQLVGPANYTADFIYLEFYKAEGKPEKVLSINCLGDVLYKGGLFEDYIFPPQSLRE